MAWASGRAREQRSQRDVRVAAAQLHAVAAHRHRHHPGECVETGDARGADRAADDAQPDRILDGRRRSIRDNAAPRHHHDPVGGDVRLVQVVGREEDGAAALGESLHRLPETAPGLDVHGRGGLVEDEQPGIADQRHREAESLRLAAGEAVDPAPLDAPELGDLDDLIEREGSGVEAPRHAEQLDHLDAGHHPAVLEHRADQAASGGGPRLGAEHADAAGVRRHETEEHRDRRRLAGAVRSEQGERLAALHGEAQAVDGEHRSEAAAHRVEHHCLGGRPRSPARPEVCCVMCHSVRGVPAAPGSEAGQQPAMTSVTGRVHRGEMARL